MKRKGGYRRDLPRAMYTYFLGYSDRTSHPSFSKFARSIGITTQELESYREHTEFERAYRECNEIRRDYLIDAALTKRFDPTFTRYLLSECEDEGSNGESDVHFTLEVLSEDKP